MYERETSQPTILDPGLWHKSFRRNVPTFKQKKSRQLYWTHS